LFAMTLAAILLAAIGLRLRLHPAAMVALVMCALFVTTPLNVKYALPVVWCFVLLPTPLLQRRWWGLAVRFVVPALMFWMHVELAIMLTAGTILFEMFGAREGAWRQRLERSVALAAGLVAGLASEALYYGVRYDMPFGELNRQVILGQARQFPKHFGWPFFSAPTDAGGYLVVALYPTLLLLPFVPLVWRRLSDPTRFVAFLALCLATVAIRRPGPGHPRFVAILVATTVVLTVCDLQAQRPRTERGLSATSALAAAGGAAWAGLTVALGFGLHSFAAPVILVLSVTLVVVVVARYSRSPLFWASGGALVVLALLPVAAAADRGRDMVRTDDPFQMADGMAAAIGPEVDRCLDGTDEALIIPTVLPLYDRLGLRNPTPYYLFHYDFGRNEDDVLDAFETGRVPGVIAAMSIPDYLPWLTDSLVDNYVLCSRVRMLEQRHVVDIWVHRSRAPAVERSVTVAPDGSRQFDPLEV
jgi:hypothetical protein